MANISNSGDAGVLRDVLRDLEQRTGGNVSAALRNAALRDEPASKPYIRFQRRHEEYSPEHWAIVRALYHGGRRLLENKAIMAKVFPKHRNEYDGVYNERKARAAYTPYCGEIIDSIVAALFTQPIELVTEEEANEDILPEYYANFFDDCSRPGSRCMSFERFLRRQVLRALLFNRAWTRIDMPEVRDDDGNPVTFDSRGAEEEAGALDAYLVDLEPEQVLNWRFDDEGELVWVMIGSKDLVLEHPLAPSAKCVERYLVLDRSTFQAWQIEYTPDQPPEDMTPVYLVAEGDHSFGRVPVVTLELPEGLQAMEKLYSLQRAHFQLANGLGWASIQSSFPELYEFLAPEYVPGQFPGEAQQDPERATNQVRGQGWVQVRGKDDRAEFVGPPTEAFAFNLELLKHKKDEMHRVTHQMGNAADVGSAALNRSGESKKQDNKPSITALQAIGEYVREHAENILRDISEARNEEFADEWQAMGMERFDIAQVEEILASAVEATAIDIPSPTFQKRHKFQVAKALLGEAATDEDLEQIELELERNITDETFSPGAGPDDIANVLGQFDIGGDDDDDDEAENENADADERGTAG